MPRLPSSLRSALRHDVQAPPPERLEQLAASIDDAAAPLLAERRRVTPAWWDIPAAWAATLIPCSLILAAASMIVLWRVQPPRPDLEIAWVSVDQATNALITPPRR